MTPVLEADVAVKAGSWQEAVRASCQLLRTGGAVEERSIERWGEIVHEQGPSIVIAPGIALAHARPEVTTGV